MLRGSVRFKLILAYFPPRPWEKKELNKWKETGTALMKWVDTEWQQTPMRVTPIIMTDLNSQLDGRLTDDPCIGPYGKGKPNDNDTRFTKWMRSHSAAAVNTHLNAGPTYVSPHNVGKTIDYIIIPIECMPTVNSCAVWRHATRKVRATPYTVDHICMGTCFWIQRRKVSDVCPFFQ